MGRRNKLWRLPLVCALLLLVQIGVVLGAPALAAATATPPPPPEGGEQEISFGEPDDPGTPEDFFGTDDRSEVADYDSPAYVGNEPELGEGEENPEDLQSYLGDLLKDNADTVDIVIFLTLLSIIPTMLVMLSGFTRIVIVLSFTRNAMGTQNMPPNQVIVGLALFLTFFVMFPVLSQINDDALQPYLNEEIDIQEAGDRALVPIRTFMMRQTYLPDLDLFLGMSDVAFEELPIVTIDGKDVPEYPMHVLIPAFLTSEIKHAFLIGFVIFIPFLVIDMIVASTLMSMGMMMLPPVMISLPFKILLFVAVDGWGLLVQMLVTSFKMGGG